MAEALRGWYLRLALIADTFPPLRSSGAVQLRDLSAEFVRQGHHVTALIAAHDLDAAWRIEELHGVRIVRLKVPRTKDVGFVRRAIGETLMPFVMLQRFRTTPLAIEKWDGVVWYSPTIFLGPVARALQVSSRCKGYLIVRDIFPDWAVDMGLMRRGAPYAYFRAVANYQYSVADIIGIQTPGNAAFFTKWSRKPGRRLEILHNWLAPASNIGCSISMQATPIAGRKVLVYAGNMGVAQGASVLIDLAEKMRSRSDLGFAFVGRGTSAKLLMQEAHCRRLDNVVFFDEIEPEEIPGLFAQCHVGLLALDPRHRTHNIPGKFLAYMQSGLPVLATVNPGNDIVELIRSEGVGRVCVDGTSESLAVKAEQLLADMESDSTFPARCKLLAAKMFSPEVAASKIVSALGS